MANSVLPEELMLCILSRLPVKTITRFKSVCKPWFHLFSTPEFKKLHQAQFSSNPENQSFIIHSFDLCCIEPKNQFSIFNIEYYKKKPTILDPPFAHAQNIKLDTVGCCNGLFCILRGQEVVLWNPATKMSKTVPLKDRGPNNMVSLGFGYDAIEDDFKVVMIVANFVYDVGMNITSVEIYSVNLGSWITVDVGFQFIWFLKTSTLIVNGNPYWDARVDGKWVLVCFDVLELVFKIVPIPTIFKPGLNEDASTDVDLVELDGLDEETKTGTRIWTNVEFVDWNGALGAIIIVNHEAEYSVAGSNCCTSTVEYSWVFDDIKRIWRNNHTFGPIELDLNVTRPLHCTKTEKILCKFSFDKMLVLDLETGCVEELFDGARLQTYFRIYGYTESLAHINGMEKVVVKNEQNDSNVCS